MLTNYITIIEEGEAAAERRQHFAERNLLYDRLGRYPPKITDKILLTLNFTCKKRGN